MKVEFTSFAQKEWKKLSLLTRRKVSKKLPFLSSNPFAGKKLKGELQEFYSLRIWPYRILYTIEKKTILVHAIEHRQSIYKN